MLINHNHVASGSIPCGNHITFWRHDHEMAIEAWKNQCDMLVKGEVTCFCFALRIFYSYEWIINWNYQYAQITLQYVCKYMYNVWHIDGLYENVRQRRRWGVIKSRAWLQFNLTLICIFFYCLFIFLCNSSSFFCVCRLVDGVGKVIQLQVESNNNSFSLQVCLSSYLMKYITRIKNWTCLSAFAALKIAHSKVSNFDWSWLVHKTGTKFYLNK